MQTLKNAALALLCVLATPLHAQQLTQPDRDLARGLLKQLIEINTSHNNGNTTTAAEAMRQRLLAAGFPAQDLFVGGPDATHGNLVARYRGKPGSTLKPVLMIAHLDVVNANREDWTSDPFQLVEKDGYFYGRGTQDIKECDAAYIATFLMLKGENFVPDRDLIIALTADEESGDRNGVDWLLKNHHDLVDAAFVLNQDSGGLMTDKGKPVYLGVEATEKLYADFRFTVTNPGGHSSLPQKNNAIYHLAAALGKLSAYQFPLELNTVTRAYFEALAKTQTASAATLLAPAVASTALDMRAVSATSPDMAAAARLSADPEYNAMLRTTCVATMLTAGHAPNALPQRAEANINCRILPGHSPREVHQQLARIVDDPTVTIEHIEDNPSHNGEDELSTAPPPLNKEVFDALHAVTEKLWPGTPVIPEMETGASDSRITMEAGLPSYGFDGMGVDKDDIRAHGKDERIGVESYYTGVQFTYLYTKALTSSK